MSLEFRMKTQDIQAGDYFSVEDEFYVCVDNCFTDSRKVYGVSLKDGSLLLDIRNGNLRKVDLDIKEK